MEIGIADRHQKTCACTECGEKRHDDGSLYSAAADALVLARAEILRSEAGQCRAEGVERRHGQHVELVCCTEAVLRGI